MVIMFTVCYNVIIVTYYVIMLVVPSNGLV